MSEQETTTQTNKGCFFLKKLWKGEYPLFVSFWGFGFLVLFCLGFLFAAIPQKELSEWLIFNFGPMGGFIAFLIFCVCFYVYIIILYVGIWRSANKYAGRSIWKVITKILVCFWWIFLFGQTYLLVKNISPVINKLSEINVIKNLKEQAEKGDEESLYNLGEKYYKGDGVEQNYYEALKIFTELDEKYDNALAQIRLAGMYSKGKGCEQDDKKEFEYIKKVADKGFAFAQYETGRMYHFGIGVEQNYQKAFEFLSKAAEKESIEAQYLIAGMYLDGKGVEQNYQKAFEWFLKIAEKNNVEEEKKDLNIVSQYLVGMMYKNGDGVKQNLQEAIKWLEKAAEQGHTDAQIKLWSIYSGNEEYKQALKWLTKAAEQENGFAQLNLGLAYELGKGVRQDLSIAKEWYGKACDNGVQPGCGFYKKLNEQGIK